LSSLIFNSNSAISPLALSTSFDPLVSKADIAVSNSFCSFDFTGCADDDCFLDNKSFIDSFSFF